MYARISERSWKLPCFALLAMGSVAMRFAWIHGDLDRLVVTVLPDDAFYYFEIARRVWMGQGVTFDGVARATGMHPLWLLAILPFFRHTSAGDVAPLHGVLFLSALLAALAALQVLRFAWRVTGSLFAGVMLGFAFLANYWVVELSLNGLETMLALALLSVFALRLLDYLDEPTRARAAWLGLLAALCILARSDMAVLLLFPCALVLWKRRRPWCSHVLLLAFFPALALLGLTLFNYALTGHLMQSSASAVPWVAQHDWHIFHPKADAAAFRRAGIGTVISSFRKIIMPMGWFTVGVGSVSLAIVIACEGMRRILSALSRKKRGQEAARPFDATLHHAALVILSIAVGLCVLHVVHGYVRWIARPYYFAAWAWVAFVTPALALRLLVPGALDGLASKPWTPAGRTLGVVLVAFMAVQLILGARGHVHYPWQIEMLRVGRELVAGEDITAIRSAKNGLKPDEPAGVFNSGMIGYVNTRPIVNLDGVVNEDAVAATRKGDLFGYIRARGIRFLADSPAMWIGQKYFATLAPWFFPDGRPLPHRTLLKIDTPDTGFPTKDDHQEIIEVLGENKVFAPH